MDRRQESIICHCQIGTIFIMKACSYLSVFEHVWHFPFVCGMVFFYLNQSNLRGIGLNWSTCIFLNIPFKTLIIGLTPTNILTPININVSGSGGGMMTSLTTSLTPSCGTQQRHQSISISAHCASMSELSSPTTNSPNLVSL